MPCDNIHCQPLEVDSACTAGACDLIPFAYCDSTTSKCKCGALFTAGTGATLGTCVVTTCATANATTCTTLDSKSRCANLKCDCAHGDDIYGSSSKCQSAGSGLMASAFMFGVGVFLTVLSF
ncbi:hypothetical protein DPMN_175589 [Dreissena polymorpha]|uniref:Uncharacterized protein n=1 Tax=Dreissena polymorpha TaxID=45954 RepID=A0A9D4IIE1_DREPO|nr:hypothetical protein DPMN_175589 [Dreissena polymorpha]